MTISNEDPLIIIASNRGPFSFDSKDDGTFEANRGAGGLVTALYSLAEKQDVIWFATALEEGDKQWVKQQGDEAVDVQGIKLRLIIPESDEQYTQYYNVISNPLLWFIQHQLWDIPRSPSITIDTWNAWDNGYVAMNRQFAEVIADEVEGTDRQVIILPQDYQLYMLPKFLRERLGEQVQIQPFVHIPWPGPDTWLMLPEAMRSALLDSLLQSDRVGFQTQRDAFNFVQTCRFHQDNAHSHGSRNSIHYHGRKVGAYAYPISIDVEAIETFAQTHEVEKHVDDITNFTGDRKLILRIDRVEPSKNIIRGLEAFRALLERYPEHHGNVQMLALLVPSRMKVDEYQNYLQDIMSEAGMINAEYGNGSWEPVRILLGNNYARAIAAMRLYDVLLVNPIADGMNLVAKEGVVLNQNDGVLVLSERAGAFYELGEFALSISPFDTYSTAEALNQALIMPKSDARLLAVQLQHMVRNSDVKEWLFNQVSDAFEASKTHDRNTSTSDTPETIISALSDTEGGVSSDSTPTA